MIKPRHTQMKVTGAYKKASSPENKIRIYGWVQKEGLKSIQTRDLLTDTVFLFEESKSLHDNLSISIDWTVPI